MMTSMYSGVSGLKAQQQKLDVIGNNIANINTVGYKGQTVSFSDLLSQTISGATGANATSKTGGTNAKQVGLGVNVAAISTNMTNGSTQTTGNANDVSISGNGFFIVQGGAAGEYQFTRAGNFSMDESGNLTVNGDVVCGWEDYTVDADGNYVFNTQSSVEPINFYSDSYNGNKKICDPQATTSATIGGSLAPSAEEKGTALNNITLPLSSTADATATMLVYDGQGNSYHVQVKLYKCYTDSTNNTTSYYWQADPSDTSALSLTNASGYIEFGSDGKILTGVTGYNSNPTITMTPQWIYSGATAFTVSTDFSGIKYYSSSSDSGIAVSAIDGYPAGELEDFTISSDGVVMGVYSNDQKQPLGMIALANFNNPAGLEKVGNNLYIATANSGDFTGGVAAGAGGTGSLSAGTLEMSNVDLSEQFSEMMMAQRAYQANSKIITTTDNMLEIIVNLMR